ncbi:MAG: hypothetical protein HYW04_11235, partial [Deltaproteobacteria bacterium]|nr:hypothetical protein [Deltaproteobacteria bacterium]
MTAREVLQKSEEILRGIIRSIDKDLDYTLPVGSDAQGARFTLQLSTRGRAATVSLSMDDLKSAEVDAVRKNAVRQKIKSARDHMLDNNLKDVLGTKVARMRKGAGEAQEAFQRSSF